MSLGICHSLMEPSADPLYKTSPSVDRATLRTDPVCPRNVYMGSTSMMAALKLAVNRGREREKRRYLLF